MCGIAGVFNNEDASNMAKKAIAAISYRGTDKCGISNLRESNFADTPKDFEVEAIKGYNAIAHCLHSIVGIVPQPLNNCFVANCEIYNWKELNNKYKLNVKNDAELLMQLLGKKGISCLPELDGVYAFCYVKENKVIIARDIIGIKPAWYATGESFAFASEKKALEKLGYIDIIELNPRKIIEYDLATKKLKITEREFFPDRKEITPSKEKVLELVQEAVKKRIPEKKFGLLFSGGIDSTIIAAILKKLGADFTCYTAAYSEAGQKEAADLEYSRKVAKSLGLKLKEIIITKKEIPKLLKEIVPLIEDSNVTKASVALPFFTACRKAKEDGCKVIFSGLGSEELFAGYQRHRNSNNINNECYSGLLKIYERDMYRDDVITMYNQIELRLPLLDLKLAKYALKIPSRFKMDETSEKIILREAAKPLNIPNEFRLRKKKAAQYGSNFMKAIEKLSKEAGFKYKSEYLKQFYPNHNLKLCALSSTGKDSIYAAYVMQKQNYEISCIVTIKSTNPDSYMYHTPNVHLSALQAEAMGVPLIEQETTGEKEAELEDLEKALVIAKNKYKIDGVITGALYSNYQRKRVEEICDRLGLKVFSPLWHKDQELLMREILENGFSFMLTKVAADGLDKSWLGREITHKDIDKLVALNEKIGINIAFEGGEAESLMISGPIFNKKIKVKKSAISMENQYTGTFEIIDAELV